MRQALHVVKALLLMGDWLSELNELGRLSELNGLSALTGEIVAELIFNTQYSTLNAQVKYKRIN
jgi:hypothetical protein